MEKKKFNLKIWIPVAVVILVIIVCLATLVSSKTRVAFLNIESGAVEVDTGKGWAAAEDGMELGLEDKVKTGEDGSAVIVLYESIMVQLDANTEVSIAQLSKDKVKINQQSGSTWNKFAAISGIKNFEVETPTTVATVRGTEFWVDMDSIGVDEGQVDAKMKGKLLTLMAGKKGVLRDGVANEEGFSDKDIQRALSKKEMLIKHFKKLRQDEINKHNIIVGIIKKTRGLNDDDVTRFLNKLDNGELDENTVRSQSPLPAKSIDKFARMTTEIKKQKADLLRLQTLRQELSGTGTAPDTVKQELKGTLTKPIEDKPLLDDKPDLTPIDKPLLEDKPILVQK